jgi:predicted RNase H-like nuclease (RuvC/YqgF family)
MEQKNNDIIIGQYNEIQELKEELNLQKELIKTFRSDIERYKDRITSEVTLRNEITAKLDYSHELHRQLINNLLDRVR